MITKFAKRPKGERSTSSPPGYEVQYVCEGSDLLYDVQTYANFVVDPFLLSAEQILYKQEINCEKQGHRLFYVTVTYGPRNRSLGEWELSGTTRGGTARIFAARELIAKYPDSLPDTLMIGEKPDGTVEGMDIPVPLLQVNIRIKMPVGVLTPAYAKNIARCTGKVNSFPWCTFGAGEALYLGCDFKSSSGTTEVEVEHSIIFQENIPAMLFAGFFIQKYGWDVAWPKYGPAASAAQDTMEVKGVYVQRPLIWAPFQNFLGFG